MSVFQTIAPLVITCNKRLSPFLATEIEHLGFSGLEPFPTGVRLEGTLNDCIRLNLSLRCASQVLYQLFQFKAKNADEVYAELKELAWEDILPQDGYFSVTANVFNDTINNSMFANLRVKDAIVDRMRNVHGERPSTGSELNGAVIHLHWQNDEATIFIDSSGSSLARHGYRKLPGRAPMLEALAAATILATKWDRKSPFVNPMCGSGTLAIEAALLATDTRPGLFRSNFGFMHIIGYEEDIFLQERNRLESLINEEIEGLQILATDYSSVAIDAAKKNAKAAGVAHLITFAVCDFKETKVPETEKGVVMFNPEYGERLGDSTELETTYKEMGDFMKNRCGGYWGYIFTGNLELAKHIGLKAKRRIEFFSSKIDCRLLEFELYAGSKRKPLVL
ncbi:MAG: class I SAM-dependent RNA methyltransferase [Chitinophagaceae bacterium]